MDGYTWVAENLNPLVTDKGEGVTHELPFLPVDGSTWIDAPLIIDKGESVKAEEKPTIDPATVVTTSTETKAEATKAETAKTEAAKKPDLGKS
ncbi:hypothetical protein E4U03_10495 [Rothia nasimurium]|uniref:Uncharacterized protein n=1 Tax=Rothia nasimurium TaxID=85336 RepID=A0A4Y9F2F2_9MICC|nr:hypothetical protein [Rothia nasimurium]MBF0809024.1 hypothetical protein [Rothia nasimurium]TFU20878.1 hypothetical protein E4U03_10495 [Rothia nasimurium]